MSKFRSLGSFLLDPPGWIPAWVLTGFFLWVVWKAVQAGSIVQAMDKIGTVYQGTLAVWLGYKGIGLLSRAIEARYSRVAESNQKNS